MNSKNVSKQIPEHWMYRVSQTDFEKELTKIKSKMRTFLTAKYQTQDSKAPSWSTIISQHYMTDLFKANALFQSFCTVVTKALLFKKLHAYLFPFGRTEQLWMNSVLSKLSGKDNREMFFLMVKNQELFQVIKNAS